MMVFGAKLGWLPISGLRSLNSEDPLSWRQELDYVGHLCPSDRA